MTALRLVPPLGRSPMDDLLPCCDEASWCRWCCQIICAEHGPDETRHDSTCAACHTLYCTDPACDPWEDR